MKNLNRSKEARQHPLFGSWHRVALWGTVLRAGQTSLLLPLHQLRTFSVPSPVRRTRQRTSVKKKSIYAHLYLKKALTIRRFPIAGY